MNSNKYNFEEGEVLLFNKPLYWTSFDLVKKVRIEIEKSCGLKKLKVGHAGTLDPMATGLMIICTGKATKRIDDFKDLAKEYIATIRLGQTTPSFDLETSVDNEYPCEHISSEMVKDVLKGFEGEQMQEPPLFSAKYVDGKRAYELARKKVEKKLEPVKVIFHEIELLEFNNPVMKVRVRCSKGTYIRAFARDIGLALGNGAYMSGLVRTTIGEKKLSQALDVEEFKFILRQTKQNSNYSV